MLIHASPATTPEQPTIRPIGAQENDSALSILVIDDQRTMRKIVRELLNRNGIRKITEASDGQEALDLLVLPETGWIDLIICDLMMEGMDGLTFCNKIRHDEALRQRHMPILMLTAERDPMLLEVVRQVGAADVANKPISAPDLGRRIERLVGVKLN